MKRLFFILLAAMLSIVSYAQTQEKNDTIFTLLSPVSITANRVEAQNDCLTQPVSVINHLELVRLSPMSSPDALAAMAGVWMQKTNHGGGSPFIRGLTGYHTLQLIDGIRFNNSTFRSGPNQYLSTVDAFTLQGVEVLRGTGSVQYGSDAIGGVAHLFLRDAAFSDTVKAVGRIVTRYTSDDMEYTGRVEAEIASSQFSSLAGVSYNQFGHIKAGEGIGTLAPTGFDQASWDVKSRWKLGKTLFTSVYQHLKQDNVPLYHQIASGAYRRYHFTTQQRDLAYLRSSSNFRARIISKVQITFAYLHSLESREKQRTNSAVLRSERDEVDTWHAAIELTSEFSRNWRSSSGIDYYFDQLGSRATERDQFTREQQLARGLYPDGASYQNMAMFSMHSFTKNRLSVTTGVRFNLFRLRVKDPQFGRITMKPEAVVGHIGALYKLNDFFFVLGSSSTGFRAPNVNDVASLGVADYRYEVPNFRLAPEKSFQYQAGFRLKSERWRGEVHVYRNLLTNLIGNVSSTYLGFDSLDGFKVYRKENINKAQIQGVECELHWSPVSSMSGFVNLTYAHGDNTSKNEPLSRIPPLFGTLGIDFHIRTVLTCRFEILGATKQARLSSGDKTDIRIRPGGTPEWGVFNTRFEYRTSRWILNAGVRNIMDKRYRIHGSGIDGLGRNVWVSVIVEVGKHTSGKV